MRGFDQSARLGVYISGGYSRVDTHFRHDFKNLSVIESHLEEREEGATNPTVMI